MACQVTVQAQAVGAVPAAGLFGADAAANRSARKSCRFTLPATKALPFVKLRADDQPLWRPESFWNVEPTGRREADLRLGRKYARLAIAAMKADHESDLIALVIQDIIKDSVERSRKNGRGTQQPGGAGLSRGNQRSHGGRAAVASAVTFFAMAAAPAACGSRALSRQLLAARGHALVDVAFRCDPAARRMTPACHRWTTSSR